MQHQLTTGELLDEHGNLREAGYAFQLVKKYNRKAIKASKWRIKEWDYYYIGDANYGLALTVADNSYMWMCTVSIINFKKKFEITKSRMGAFSFGKVGLPHTSVMGDIAFVNKGCAFKFSNNGVVRRLQVHYPNFDGDDDFDCDILLKKTINDTMVIATPWDKPKHFYYNQKINCLCGGGNFSCGIIDYTFNSAYGVLDWGRGVWTYKNTWYWSSMSACQDGKSIGFNLGYGFGNTSAASENMLFYGDRTYKLEDVTFNIPTNEKGDLNYLEPWTFTSSDGNINLKFEPIIDRNSNINAVIIHTIQHQVFGVFSGTIKTYDDVIEIKNQIGFAERVYMKY